MLIYWSFQVLRWILQWSKLLSIFVSTLKTIMAPSFELCFYFYSVLLGRHLEQFFVLITWAPLKKMLEIAHPWLVQEPCYTEILCLVNVNIENPSTVSYLFSCGSFLPIPLLFYCFLLTSPQRRLFSFRSQTLEIADLQFECNWSCCFYNCCPNPQRFHFQSEGGNNSTT